MLLRAAIRQHSLGLNASCMLHTFVFEVIDLVERALLQCHFGLHASCRLSALRLTGQGRGRAPRRYEGSEARGLDGLCEMPGQAARARPMDTVVTLPGRLPTIDVCQLLTSANY
jgi:hypothetical protein